MEISIFEILLHLDESLMSLIGTYGSATYAILTAVIFCETGLVFTPFLPGDSLLFVAGAISATGSLNVWLVFLLLTAAAIVGDTVNYLIGKNVGERILARNGRLIKRENIDKTHAFFDKYGAKTIVIARFVPIVRTVAPFVAGIGKMDYKTFISYNIFGGLLWTSLFIWGGYFFGNIPLVKENFTAVILLIIFASILPGIYEYLKARRNK